MWLELEVLRWKYLFGFGFWSKQKDREAGFRGGDFVQVRQYSISSRNEDKEKYFNLGKNQSIHVLGIWARGGATRTDQRDSRGGCDRKMERTYIRVLESQEGRTWDPYGQDACSSESNMRYSKRTSKWMRP